MPSDYASSQVPWYDRIAVRPGDRLKQELREAIAALWQNRPNVQAWNAFWLDRCCGQGQWKFPEDLEFNLPLELGTNIAGRDWAGIILMHGTAQGKNFSNHGMNDAILYHCDFRNCLFYRTELKNADLRGAHFGGADLSFADLSGADLTGARFKGAKLYQTKLNDANLRFAQDIEFDENSIQGASFTSLVSRFARKPQDVLPEEFFDWGEPLGKLDDHWSKLRRTYTGPRFALLLLLTIAFLLPHILQVVFLASLGQAESDAVNYLSRQSANTSAGQAPDAVTAAANDIAAKTEAVTREALDRLEAQWQDVLTAHRAKVWKEIMGDLANGKRDVLERVHYSFESEKQVLIDKAAALFAQNRSAVVQQMLRDFNARPRHQVWEILLGLDRGSYRPVLLGAILIVFNLLRMGVTFMVSSLREAEDRSGITPAKREYGIVYQLHRVVTILWIFAILDLFYTAWIWLRTPVVML